MSENKSFKNIKEENLLSDIETQNLVLSKVTLTNGFPIPVIQQKNFMSIFFVFFTKKALNTNFGGIDSQTLNSNFKIRN